MVVDAHTHVVPPALVAAMRSGAGPDGARITADGGREWIAHRQGYRYPLEPQFHDLEARLAAMDAAGTDVSVVSIAPPFLLYWAPAGEARDVARQVNDGIAAMCAEAGGRLIGLATLPMHDPDAAAQELQRGVQQLGLRGAQLGTTVEGTPLDDPAFAPVLAMAERLGVPLVVHPYYVGSAPGYEDFYLTNLVNNPLQTTICAARLIFSGALDRHPDLTVVLVHAGGHLPFQIGRLDHGRAVRSETQGCRHEPSAYLRRFAYDTITFRGDALRFLVSVVGADRVLYGTDLPFDMADADCATVLGRAELAGDTAAAVGGVNANRVFAAEEES